MKRIAILILLVASAAHAGRATSPSPGGAAPAAPAPASGVAPAAPVVAAAPAAEPTAPSEAALASPPRALTFQGAIELALGQSAELDIAREAIASARARTAGLEARRYPTLHVEAAANLYRSAYELPFGAETLTLHEQLTTATSVTLAQPLTRLAYLSELVGAAAHDHAALRQDYDRARLDTAYRTAEAYLRVLITRAGGDVAQRSVADLKSGLERAVQFRAADTTTDIDVLRFRSAKAAADQAALRAEAALQGALATLAVQLGLPDGTPLAVADDLPPTPPALAMTLEQAQQRAVAARPELRAAHEKIAAADESRRAARSQYVPDLRAVGVFEHVTGVQPFQPENSAFVGLRLSWNVWDWGATHQAVLEAEHTRARASRAESALIEQVRLEVRKRWLEASTLFTSMAVAQQQQQTADEAYRLQQVRFDNAAATATDVLDAETEAARARLGSATARYDYFLALVALARSVGDLPGPVAGP